MNAGAAPALLQEQAAIRIADFTTVPNLLSLARVAGVAAAVLLYFEGYPRVTVILGTAACLTDHLDGYLARRWSQVSTLGAMLDQAADSFTIAIAMAMLVIAGGFPFVFLVIFLLREFWVATVRRYAALGNVEIPSHVSGKLATAVIYYAMLLMAIALMLDVPEAAAARMRPFAVFGMGAGLALSWLAGVRYTLALVEEGAMTSRSPARARTEVLLCPGPVMLSPGVKQALAECEIGHRDARFSELVARLRRRCGVILGANERHSVIFLSGPATATIEAACASLFQPDAPVIVPLNGAFGARIVEIVRVHDIPCIPIDFGFGKPFDLARIEAALVEQRERSPAALAMTHHETSAGLINPIAEVCALAHRHGLRTLVDATSSAGAEDLDVIRDRIDVCITSSGKCLHAPPGIGIACVRRDMLSGHVAGAPRSYSLDLLRHHDQLETNSQTPFTPAVPLFAALDQAVEELFKQGIAERRRSYARRRAFLAAELARLGLRLLPLPAGTEACSILTVEVPRPFDLDGLYWSMRERGYVIYRTKAPLAPHYFQVSVMGELSEADLSGFLRGLESLLSGRAGRRCAATG